MSPAIVKIPVFVLISAAVPAFSSAAFAKDDAKAERPPRPAKIIAVSERPRETGDTVLAWKNTVVTTSDADRVVRLRDIANVVRDYTDPPSKIMRDNGLPAVIIGVSTLPRENIVEGKPRFDAVVDSAANRVRPVMMGSLTTVLGVVPLFLDAFLKSMAAVLVFGLSFATLLILLILLIVPALYMVFFRIRLDETART